METTKFMNMKVYMGEIRIVIIFISLVLLTGSVFPGSIEITKVGEWGSSYYLGVFVQGNYAYCAAYYSGLDIIDISSKKNPVKIGNYDTYAAADTSAIDVVVKGNYAYVACSRGLMIIDITNPAAPSRVGRYDPSLHCRTSGVFVKDNYAYIMVDCDGLHIIDVTDPAVPILMGKYAAPGAEGVYVEGSYAYIMDNEIGFSIIDVSNPASPRRVGACVTSGGNDVYVRGNYAYLGSNRHGLVIIDISNSTSPKEVGFCVDIGGAFDVTVSGNYAYVADQTTGLNIVNISLPSSPRLVGSYETIGAGWGICVMNNDFAFIANSGHGLQIIDISEPTAPEWVSSYDQSGMAMQVVGKDDYVYLADWGGGMRILDVSVPSTPTQAGNYDTFVNTLDVAFRGNYAYIVREVYGDANDGLWVVDVSLPGSPRLVGSCPLRDAMAFHVFLSGDYAYAAGYGGFRIIDISDPSSPSTVGSFHSPGTAQDVYVEDKYAYLANGENGLYIFNISKPTRPALLTTYNTSKGLFTVYVKDHCAYMTDGPDGFTILDVSEPSSPKLLGHCKTPYGPRGIYVAGDYAYLANGDNGLQVIDIKNPKSPRIVASYYTKGDAQGVYVQDNYVYIAEGITGRLLVLKISEKTPSHPQISLNRTFMNFGFEKFGASTPAQTLLIDNTGDESLHWSAETDQNWLLCTPASGTDAGTVSVAIDASSLAAGTYPGVVTVSDPNATNSPQTVTITLKVYDSGQTSLPFGSFDTPAAVSTVSGSVPFTGWALDDIGIDSVKLYRQEGTTLVYIGDGNQVEGARPDIQSLYGQYPNNHKAGWGYLMLTNFLPNGGNGTFTFHAIATDLSGDQVTLGTKTVTVDNAHAVKPFGSIDTPAQGGEAHGANFIVFGWALTPPPNTIPPDGSTIAVWVDGAPLEGNPVYNRYREDIAELFPGYNNSGGAGGHYSLDTTLYANGVHTISWNVTDDAGNTDGIGSRYFNITNPANKQQSLGNTEELPPDIPGIPVDYSSPVQVIKGDDAGEPLDLYPGDKDVIAIEIKELERVEIRFEAPVLSCSALPIGSSLKSGQGVFYWQPGPGFLGEHRFVFLEKRENNDFIRRNISIIIHPKFSDN